jgi:hypothetical protein
MDHGVATLGWEMSNCSGNAAHCIFPHVREDSVQTQPTRRLAYTRCRVPTLVRRFPPARLMNTQATLSRKAQEQCQSLFPTSPLERLDNASIFAELARLLSASRSGMSHGMIQMLERRRAQNYRWQVNIKPCHTNQLRGVWGLSSAGPCLSQMLSQAVIAGNGHARLLWCRRRLAGASAQGSVDSPFLTACTCQIILRLASVRQ